MIDCKGFHNLAARLRVGFFVVLFFGCLCPGFAAGPDKISDSAAQQIGALEQEKSSRSPLHRKLDSQFVYQLKQKLNLNFAPGVTRLRPDIKFEPDGRILVDIEANVTGALLAQIQQSGGTVVNSFPQFHHVRALVAMDQLETLAGSADVKFIGRARRAQTNTGSVDSEGDVTHRANTARSTFGVNGQGIKVGVLSDSIDNLAQAQASGDLGNVTVLPGQAGSGSGEGTAMLEIIYDLAPGAQLYFATAFNGEASFAQNILDLRSNGCDVIVDDVGYFDESPFEDGIIAQAVNSVTASGALYFSAAGNDGNLKDNTSCTWEGDFVDAGPAVPPENIGGGHIHSFGNATYNTVIIAGAGVDLFWSDPLGASTNDYDLFVLDPTGNYVVASSTNPQNGTQDPYEEVSYVSAGDRIVIVKTTGDARFLHLDTSRGALSIKTTGATRGHSAAAAAFSVAAVDALDSFPNPFSGGSQDPVEVFSSDGPRRVFYNADGTPITPGNYSSTGGVVRQKPDIAAADGVKTSLYNFNPFYGTSAAAPHAAAIAAMLLAYNPGLTPGQIRTTLTNTALDIEDPGVDVNSGAGIVMAYQALQSLPPEPVLVPGSMVLLNESCPNGAIDPGETVTVALSITNTGFGNTANLMGTLLSTGGVTSPSGPQNYGFLAGGGGTTSEMFTFIAAGNCGDTNTATLQLRDGTNNLGTVSFAFQLGIPRVPLLENFDEVTPPALPSGWITGRLLSWTTTSNASDTAPNSAFRPDSYGASQSALYSPPFYIVTPSAQLTFRQSMDTYYYGFDGGVLEFSFDGGVTYMDILAAGGSFVTNGYNDTLATGSGNPIGGRSAWSGYLGGFVTTIVNLPASAAGQTVRLRWLFGTSSYYGGSGGWNIDTVSVADGIDCCVPVPNDLVVSISGTPNPVVVGGNLTYTINAENTGPNTATGVSLTDVLPPNFTLQSISVSQNVYPGPQANGGGTLVFNLGSLTGGSTATITITGSAGSVGSITNQVSVSRTDPGANTNYNTASAITAVIAPSLSINDVSLFEGSSGTTNAVFTVSLWPPPGQTATVQFATSNQTAVAGTDYVGASGTLTFAPGMTNRTVAVPVIGSLLNEATKTFTVNLFNPTNAVLAKAQGVGTILNDNPLPYVMINDVTVVKPASGTTNALFNISLNIPSGQTVTLNFNTSDGTAIGGTDYVPTNGYLTFNPGQTSQTVSVVVTNHVSVKPGQTFFLNLNGVSNAKLVRTQALGTIITVLPGQIDHLAWSGIASPQSNGLPIGVTITAQDYYNTTVSNFNGTVSLLAMSRSGNGVPGGSIVPYFTDNNPSSTGPQGPITLAGFTPLQVTDISALNLNNYKMLFIDEANNGVVSSALLGRLADIQVWVNNGGRLIVHDRSAGDLLPNPFLLGTTGITTMRDTTSDIDVIPPGMNLVVAGPFGTINNSTLDGGNSSAHGYVPQNQLPPSASAFLSIGGNPSQVVAFSYPLGSGQVYYSTIPLDYYLDGGGAPVLNEALQQIYTPNVLAYVSGSGSLQPVPITPPNSGNFVNGVWSGSVTVQQPATNVTLQADDGFGHLGVSNPFNVTPTPGQTTHFVWSAIPSPQSNGVPFAVTITAQDYFNGTATNFTGAVALSGSTGASSTNTILPAPAYISSSSGDWTLGYAFTPSTNLTVTGVRSYFGTKVSIWTAGGTLLASQNVTSVPGTWVETPLASPIQLTAGTTYRLAAYTGGGNYYWRSDMEGSFPNGTINQGCEVSGDAFPNNSDSVTWWFVDIQYTVGTVVSVPVSPGVSGGFANGIWRGSLSVNQVVTNLTLLANDSQGHTGSSNPFNLINFGSAPTATTLSPTIVANGATLNATVNPNQWDTTVYFLWGTSVGFLTNLTPVMDVGAGSTPLTVTSSIMSLAPYTQYYYQVVASNYFGTVSGAQVAFWSPPFAVVPNEDWDSVASSADGSVMVGVANPGPIYISTNSGAVWNQASNAPIGHWQAVACSADGSKIIAAAGGSGGTLVGPIYTSPDMGVTWVSNNAPVQNWQSVASSADGTNLAAADYADQTIYTSTNSGATWAQVNVIKEGWYSIALSADGSKLSAAASGFRFIFTSTNFGGNWSAHPVAAGPHGTQMNWTSIASSVDGSKLVAAGGGVGGMGNIFLSTNSGAAWTVTATNILPSQGYDKWIFVASSADGTKLAAVSESGLPGGVITSTNSGATWITNSVPNLTWNAVALSADGARLVATVGYPSTGPIFTTQVTPSPVLNLLGSGNSTLVSWLIPSMNFTLQKSSDLSSWTNLTALPILNLTNLQNQVVLPPPGGSGFYRLKH
jgi:uncharacterized repeat protein (TIGR01451 family)